jgi:hypothetical protein
MTATDMTVTSLFFGPSGLPPDLRELAILGVGNLSHADCETNGHEAFATKAGRQTIAPCHPLKRWGRDRTSPVDIVRLCPWQTRLP